MGLGATFGRLLFVVFLLVRGAQHIHKPEDWGSKFIAKYQETFDFTSKLNLLPGELLSVLHPKYITAFARSYGPYIGYTELLSAVAIGLQIPLLPLISATLLLIESLVFFNPLKPGIGKELYYLIIYLGVVGIIYMMSFAAPVEKVRRTERVEKEERRPEPTKGKAGERSGSNKPRRRET